MILGKELRRRVKKHQAMFVVTLADSEVQAEWQRGIGLPRSQLSQRLPERLLCPTTQLRGMDSASKLLLDSHQRLIQGTNARLLDTRMFLGPANSGGEAMTERSRVLR